MDAIFTADNDRLADLLAEQYEGLYVSELHPGIAVRYVGLAGDLVSKKLPREAEPIAKVIAEAIEDADIEQIAPWDFARHMGVALTVLEQF
ncbi:hypothetical protein AQJ30_15650 [Streptomyces longwoodensis]|uniref:Uncharacterized protein n=1 Tax=Streptomyces longwoodensis TaxID=68231 RepID=A0A101QX59_9ACTN|nr:hypothetical protein [Streptomyces longwoodensis]KUN37717.1 hypothetical protein AQJ30_15650 [Streptomyces longwoodensis]